MRDASPPSSAGQRPRRKTSWLLPPKLCHRKRLSLAAPDTNVNRAGFSTTFQTIARFREAGISIFIVILVVVISLTTSTFLNPTNQLNLFMNIAILAIVALGQTIVIIAHGIDLSVSSVIGLVAMMVAFM